MSKRNGKDANSLPAEDWQFYAWVRQTIGVAAITGAHGCAQTQAYRYCRDPRRSATNDASRTPITHLRDLFDEVATVKGGPERIRLMLDHLAASIGCHVVCSARPEPDKPTVHEERLDDYQSLTTANRLMDERQPPAVIRQQIETHKHECDQTLVAYERDFHRGGNASG